jgi:hypothetical protein
MILKNSTHLTYCTNIHSEKNWTGLYKELKIFLPLIKKEVSPSQAFGLGLRLSDHSSRELLESKELQKFKDWLSEENLYVFTLNGFPYGNFHQKRVKDDVYKPDWTTKERLEYTKRLIRILSVLLPPGMDGGISTSPISYKPWFLDSPGNKSKVLKKSAENLLIFAEEMIKVRKETGKTIHIDIEPEPDGLIEDSDEVISFFNNYLFPQGEKYLKSKISCSDAEAQSFIKEHIRICFDLCHFSLQYENHGEALKKMKAAGIRIGKVQLSSALKCSFDQGHDEKVKLYELFDRLNEQTYLHQVIQLNKDETINQYADLGPALKHFYDENIKEWRIHFHVPLFLENFGLADTTQDEVEELLEVLNEYPEINQLEVETYTWDVTPGEYRLDLIESICKEINWVKEKVKLGRKVVN